MTSINQLYMIKDVAKISGQSIYTIKFYLKLGLLKEVGRSPETGFRYFDESTVHRLAAIRNFRKAKKSLADIQRLLGDSDEAVDNTAVPPAPERS